MGGGGGSRTLLPVVVEVELLALRLGVPETDLGYQPGVGTIAECGAKVEGVIRGDTTRVRSRDAKLHGLHGLGMSAVDGGLYTS